MATSNARPPIDTAWGKSIRWIHPRVVLRVFQVFDVLNRYVSYFIFLSLCFNVIMVIVISFCMTLSKGYVADGSIYSCEIAATAPTTK